MYKILKGIALVSLIFSAHVAFADTVVSGALTGDVVWLKADGPYIVNYVSIPSGSSLTIEPGTIIKVVEGGTPFSISGTLTIGSLGAEQVVITSFKDDTVGGDTNGDGTATTPAAGDWRTFTVSTGAVVNIQNTEIKYGGYSQYSSYWGTTFTAPMIANNGGVLTVSAATFGESAYMGILQNAGTTTVTDSVFSHIAYHGVASVGGHIEVTNTTFDTMECGVAAYSSSLELGGNTFTNISSYSVSAEGEIIGIKNHSGNTGTTGFLIGGTVYGTQTLSKDGLTYVINGVTIPRDSSLTISPGVVAKVAALFNALTIEGTLIIGSSSSVEQAIITSIKDDSVGGDTNGDGTATLPSSGSWWSILFKPDSRGLMQNSTIRFGSRNDYSMYWGTWFNSGMIKNEGGDIVLHEVILSDAGIFGIESLGGTTTVTHSEIKNTQYGIFATGGTTTIHNSSIHDNTQYGVYNATANIVDATNNWWGSANGPRLPLSIVGAGDMVSLNVDYTPWLGAEPSTTTPTTTPSDVCVTDCFSNVLFLPGMMGSRLFEESAACGLFNDEKERWVSMSDCDHAHLGLSTDGKSLYPLYTKEDVSGAVDDAYSFNVYQSFMDDLDTWKNDDKIIEDYAIVPYDWRLSLEDVLQNGATSTDGKLSYGTSQGFFSAYIYNKLAELVHSSRTGKVTIIAHSNGGLLTKALMQKLKENNDPLYDKIDNIVFIAVPQVGTPEAIVELLHGKELGPLGFVMSAERLRNLTQNMPSAYHLLPSTNYFTYVDNPVITISSSTLSTWASSYGDIIHSSAGMNDFMTDTSRLRIKPIYDNLDNPEIIDPSLLAHAGAIHAILDNWTPPSGVKFTTIAGWGEETLSGIEYKKVNTCISSWSGGCLAYSHELTMSPKHVIDGDGTVVEPSALWANGTTSTRVWVDLKRYNFFNPVETAFGFLSIKHSDILEVPQLRTLLQNIIIGTTTPLDYISAVAPRYAGDTPRLHFTLHSPLTLEFFDTYGNHVGYSTTTNSIDLNVPGVRYEHYGDVQWLSIPKDIAGQLVLNGIGSGSFTLDAEEVNGNTALSTTSFEGVPSSTSTIVTMKISPTQSTTGSSTLIVDENGDGTPEMILHAKQNAVVIPDLIPPEALITFSTSTQSLLISGTDDSSPSVSVTASTTVLRLKKHKEEKREDLKDDYFQFNTIATLADQSGNTLVIPFLKYQKEKQHIILSFNTLVYNGSTTTIATTILKYQWEKNKNGTYTTFSSSVTTGATTTEAQYNLKKNTTVITTKQQDDEHETEKERDEWQSNKQKLPGMVILGLKTKEGNVDVSY